MGDVYEWKFPEPSHKVDLERICVEVNSVPVIYAIMYMQKLSENAPIVYSRLKEWACKNNRITWYKWQTDNQEIEHTG